MAEVVLDKITSTESGPGKQLTYKEFKRTSLETLTLGTIVTGISPSRLFASQDWTDTTKTARAMSNPLPSDEAFVVPAYVSMVHSKQAGEPSQGVLVVANRHHRALLEWETWKKSKCEDSWNTSSWKSYLRVFCITAKSRTSF